MTHPWGSPLGRYSPWLLSLVFALAVGGVAACDDSRTCNSDEECAGTRTCQAGTCEESTASEPDGVTDDVADDGGDAPRDAAPDGDTAGEDVADLESDAPLDGSEVQVRDTAELGDTDDVAEIGDTRDVQTPDCTGYECWSIHVVGQSVRGTGVASDVAVGSDGTVFVVGDTTDPLANEDNAGISDAFVAGYPPSGDPWFALLGSDGTDEARAVALDGSGDVYFTGVAAGAFGGADHTNLDDVFVAKYSSTGNQQWVHMIGSDKLEEPRDIAVDDSGDVYVTGSTGGDLGGRDGSPDSSDGFVAKFGSGPEPAWVRLIGTSNDTEENARGVTVGPSGGVFVAGRTSGDYRGATNNGLVDIFLVEFDSSGTYQWSKLHGTPNLDEAYAIAAGPSGNLYVAGETLGDLGGHTNIGPSNIPDAFVASYSSTGNQQWVHLAQTPEEDAARAIDVDSTGRIVLGGFTKGDLGGETHVGGRDAFAALLEGSGTRTRLHLLGTPKLDRIEGVTMDGPGTAHVAGVSRGDIANPGGAADGSSGSWKGFWARLQ